MKKGIIVAILGLFFLQNFAQESLVITGAERLELYLDLLRDKRVGIFANHTSLVRDPRNSYIHLIDTLIGSGVRIVKIFSPEHGFSGTNQNGEYIEYENKYLDFIDIIPTYTSNNKLDDSHFRDIDILVFDIQDVGARFYTYISSMQLILEASIKNQVDFLLLDRPNPNIHYVDGPVLQKKYKSFVGMQPVPVVYGMTIGEYATMLLGEKWVNISPLFAMKEEDTLMPLEKQNHLVVWNINSKHFYLVPCSNYTRKTIYSPPVPPSPNLKNLHAIQLYPSLCFFEGTIVSVGRGTEFPFECFGSTWFPDTLFSYQITTRQGKVLKYFSYDLRNYEWNINDSPSLQIDWLLTAYSLYPVKKKFFINTSFFDRLAGNNALRRQLHSRMTSAEIRKSWEKGIARFLPIRKKYLIYED